MNNTKERKAKMGSKSQSVELETASRVADFYGFAKTPHFFIEKEDISKAKLFRDTSLKDFLPFVDERSNFYSFVEERVSLMRNFSEKKLAHLPQPASVYYEAPQIGNPNDARKRGEQNFCIDMIGNSKSIADATVIETSFIVLGELYPKKQLKLVLNSVGDRESSSRFVRELTNYYKKNWSELSAHCKATGKKDIYDIIKCKDEKCVEFHSQAPQSVSFLSEASRKHFKEVLDYIEMLAIPYTIEYSLLGNKHLASGTVFEIVEEGEEAAYPNVLAFGERYNCLMKKAWSKKEVPAIGSVIRLKQAECTAKAEAKTKAARFSFYFIQLSFDAKLKSLAVLEVLRKAKIPITQSLAKDKFGSQIAQAEKLKITHVLIMGKKEAMENSVVVRDMVTRAQETVKIQELAEYIKKLK